MTEPDPACAVLDALQHSGDSAPAPQNLAAANYLRGKIAGVALRKARLANAATTEDWAAQTPFDAEQIAAWERGEAPLRLPDLELLASCLRGDAMPVKSEDYRALRQRILGIRLRMARRETKKSLADLAEQTGMNGEALEASELGQRKMPLAELTAVAQALQMDLRGFLEPLAAAGQADAALASGDAGGNARRAFAEDSENAALLRLAMAFRQVDPQQLRKIADALLAIISSNRRNEVDAAS